MSTWSLSIWYWELNWIVIQVPYSFVVWFQFMVFCWLRVDQTWALIKIDTEFLLQPTFPWKGITIKIGVKFLFYFPQELWYQIQSCEMNVLRNLLELSRVNLCDNRKKQFYHNYNKSYLNLFWITYLSGHLERIETQLKRTDKDNLNI